jgi:rod shape-determining protein MreD
VRRAILSAVVLAVALTIQLTVVNRLPLPGAGAPDLVLLAVVALGLCARPATAAVIGFAAGLCLDIAPPGSYLVGEYALVFCLIGYLCGQLRGAVKDMVGPTIAVGMAAAAAGEALVALLGLGISDPQVSWQAVQQVLPSSILYDVAATPFTLYLVMRAVRWADGLGLAAAPDGQQADGSALLARSRGANGALPGSALPGATMLGGAGLLGGAGWLAGPVGSRGSRGQRPRRGAARAPHTPRLRQAAARAGDGWVGGGPRVGLAASAGLRPARPAVARTGRPPRLRPAAGTPGSALARPPRTLPRSTVNLRISARRGDRQLGRSAGAGFRAAGLAGQGARSRAASGPPGSAFRGSRPAGGPSAARAGALARRPASSGPKFRRESRLPGGSSSGGAALGGGAPRALPARRVNLRLGSARRHDGVLGGSGLRGGSLGGGRLRGGSLGGRALRGGSLGGRALRGGSHGGGGLRGGTVGMRPVSLRLGSGRRGDSALGVLSGSRAPWARPRLGGHRRAEPRFRSSSAVTGRSLLGRRSRLRAGKRARFGGGRSSFLTTWTGGKLGGRSTVWRIGSKRTGGFR